MDMESIDRKMKKLPMGLRLAKIASEKSKYKIRVGAAYLDRSNILMAWNTVKTSARSTYDGYPYPNQQHAEWNLFPWSYQFSAKLRGTVYIFRSGAKGRLLLAKPCGPCMLFLKRIGVRSIVYTVKDSWVKEKI